MFICLSSLLNIARIATNPNRNCINHKYLGNSCDRYGDSELRVHMLTLDLQRHCVQGYPVILSSIISIYLFNSFK